MSYIPKRPYIPKPEKRMKTVAKQLERCLADDCKDCYLKEHNHCLTLLMLDCLYYLQMTLEKSERSKNVSEIH